MVCCSSAKKKRCIKEEATHAVELVSDLAQQGLEWAGPAAEKALAQASASAKEAADRVRPALGEAREKITEDYVPRINRAAVAAKEAAKGEGTVAQRAEAAAKASHKALTEIPVKKRHLGRKLGLIALVAAIAGAAYVAWRRTQPVEDPWAEDYWADLEVKEADVPNTSPEEFTK